MFPLLFEYRLHRSIIYYITFTHTHTNVFFQVQHPTINYLTIKQAGNEIGWRVTILSFGWGVLIVIRLGWRMMVGIINIQTSH